LKIWLDDIRPMPFPERIDDGKFGYPYDEHAPYDVHCTTGEAALAHILLSDGNVTFISFDHDLGNGITGYDVAKKIEESAYSGYLEIPIEYKVHSANPIGSKNIHDAMRSAWRAWKNKKIK
jgi:hypothetical protein